VRVVLGALAFDEHRLVDYRLDDKWSAHRVFAEQCGLSLPRTAGLNSYFRRIRTADHLVSALAADFGEGYVIKPVLGAGSGDRGAYDHRGVEVREFATLAAAADGAETYIVQERVVMSDELRVHTIERHVLPRMTFPRYGTRSIDPGVRTALEGFASEQLARLPDELIAGALYGWDIALTAQGCVVIEINATGFHPVWCRGYQTTGFVQEGPDADANLALLIDAVEELYPVRIDLGADDGLLTRVNAHRIRGKEKTR